MTALLTGRTSLGLLEQDTLLHIACRLGLQQTEADIHHEVTAQTEHSETIAGVPQTVTDRVTEVHQVDHPEVTVILLLDQVHLT